MPKKNTNTFAFRAKTITNKYKKRLGDDFRKFDPISRQSMVAELEALKQEQETYKQENGLNNEPQQFQSGGKLLSDPEDRGFRSIPTGSNASLATDLPITNQQAMLFYNNRRNQLMVDSNYTRQPIEQYTDKTWVNSLPGGGADIGTEPGLESYNATYLQNFINKNTNDTIQIPMPDTNIFKRYNSGAIEGGIAPSGDKAPIKRSYDPDTNIITGGGSFTFPPKIKKGGNLPKAQEGIDLNKIDRKKVDEAKEYWSKANLEYLKQIQTGRISRQGDTSAYSIPNDLSNFSSGRGFVSELANSTMGYNPSYSQSFQTTTGDASPEFKMAIDELIQERSPSNNRAIVEPGMGNFGQFNEFPRQYKRGGNLPKYQGDLTSTMLLPSQQQALQQQRMNAFFGDSGNLNISTPTSTIADPYGAYSLENAPANFQLDPQYDAVRGNINQLGESTTLQTTPQQQLQGDYYSGQGFNYLGAAATLGSGIYSYLNTPEEIEKVEGRTYRPEEVDLSSERVAARSRAQQARAMASRTARGVSGSAADYFNRATSGQVAVNRLEGEQIAGSLSREEAMNTQAENQARMMNARSKQQADMMNMRIQAMNDAGRQQQQDAIIGTATGLSQAYADYSRQQQYYDMLRVQDPYYSLYEDPNRKFLRNQPQLRLDPNKVIRPT